MPTPLKSKKNTTSSAARRSGGRTKKDKKAAKKRMKRMSAKLEKKMVTDAVKGGLESRPKKSQLIKAGLLPQHALAPSLMGIGAQLERRLKQDSLKQTLEARPTKKQLQASGIMPKTKLAPSLMNIGARLEKQMKRDTIKGCLETVRWLFTLRACARLIRTPREGEPLRRACMARHFRNIDQCCALCLSLSISPSPLLRATHLHHRPPPLPRTAPVKEAAAGGGDHPAHEARTDAAQHRGEAGEED